MHFKIFCSQIYPFCIWVIVNLDLGACFSFSVCLFWGHNQRCSEPAPCWYLEVAPGGALGTMQCPGLNLAFHMLCMCSVRELALWPEDAFRNVTVLLSGITDIYNWLFKTSSRYIITVPFSSHPNR